jgi:hypothetical protein
LRTRKLPPTHTRTAEQIINDLVALITKGFEEAKSQPRRDWKRAGELVGELSDSIKETPDGK